MSPSNWHSLINQTIEASGVPVDISKRVANQAAAGEVLLTKAVLDLVSGSGAAFADRGACNIAGIPDDCRLFAPLTPLTWDAHWMFIATASSARRPCSRFHHLLVNQLIRIGPNSQVTPKGTVQS